MLNLVNKNVLIQMVNWFVLLKQLVFALEMNKRNRVMEIFYRFMSGEHMAVKDLAAEL